MVVWIVLREEEGIKMKKYLLLFVFLLFSFSTLVLANNYKDTYVELLSEGQYDELYQHLQEWEKLDPHNAEIYIAYFNYYYYISREENLTIDTRVPENDSLALISPETGEEVAYLHGKDYYDEEKVDLALVYINEGLERYPDRLDMHFGKIFFSGQVSRYEIQVDALIDVLNISSQIDNKWLWENGEELDDGCNFMLENIQTYIFELFNMGNKDQCVVEISEKIIELYPNTVYPYNNIAAVYVYEGNYQKAIEYFKFAEERHPFDTIVISNIAYLYFLLDDKETSLAYYKKLKEYGDEQDKEFADEQIKTLENQ